MNTIAIVDYGMGNIFSIRQACLTVGMNVVVSGNHRVVTAADAMILPGVGAFGDAINELQKRGLVNAINDFAKSGRPLIGICLGFQLMMEESSEFGLHQGLGLIRGAVRRFENPRQGNNVLKVPHVGWNRIFQSKCDASDSIGADAVAEHDSWNGTVLEGIPNGSFMYFLHSYRVEPCDDFDALTYTKYGNATFCSAIERGNIVGIQFHIERSGVAGLKIFQNIDRRCDNNKHGL